MSICSFHLTPLYEVVCGLPMAEAPLSERFSDPPKGTQKEGAKPDPLLCSRPRGSPVLAAVRPTP